jgi:hypothetical protein
MVIRRVGDDSNLLQVELSDLEGKAELVSTKIGNVEAVSARAKQRGAYSPYMLGRYEIREQDFLGVWQLNGKMISSAIGSHELKGSTQGFTFTAEAADLRQFIEAHGEECFEGDLDGRPTVYYRVKSKTE